MATRDKNIWILIVFILAGLVIGGLIGQFAAKMDSLWWLAYGESFGLSEPLQLDLSIIKLTFSIMLKINISSIIGMANKSIDFTTDPFDKSLFIIFSKT